MKMQEQLATECRYVIEDYSSIRLTPEQFEELMDENPRVEKNIIRFNSPRDTADREVLLELLSIKLTGDPWPCNGDGRKAAEKFFSKLIEMANQKGYMVIGYE